MCRPSSDPARRDPPALEIDLNFSDRPVDLIEDGFDLAIRNGPLGDASGLMAHRVARQRTLVFASPSYIDRHGAPLAAEMPALGAA